jgi:hypothetical protein
MSSLTCAVGPSARSVSRGTVQMRTPPLAFPYFAARTNDCWCSTDSSRLVPDLLLPTPDRAGSSPAKSGNGAGYACHGVVRGCSLGSGYACCDGTLVARPATAPPASALPARLPPRGRQADSVGHTAAYGRCQQPASTHLVPPGSRPPPARSPLCQRRADTKTGLGLSPGEVRTPPLQQGHVRDCVTASSGVHATAQVAYFHVVG